jgi:hypothetical protein
MDSDKPTGVFVIDESVDPGRGLFKSILLSLFIRVLMD